MKSIKFELKNGMELIIDEIYVRGKDVYKNIFDVIKSLTNKDKNVDEYLENDVIDFINRNIDTITNLINEKINYMYSITHQKSVIDLFKKFKNFNFGFVVGCVIDIRDFELSLVFKYFLVYDKSKNSYILRDIVVSKVGGEIVPNFINLPVDGNLKKRLLMELV